MADGVAGQAAAAAAAATPVNPRRSGELVPRATRVQGKDDRGFGNRGWRISGTRGWSPSNPVGAASVLDMVSQQANIVQAFGRLEASCSE